MAGSSWLEIFVASLTHRFDKLDLRPPGPVPPSSDPPTTYAIMIRMRRLLLLTLLVAGSVRADVLPGFRIVPTAETRGFVTSIAFDRNDNLFYSTTSGGIFQVAAGESAKVAQVDTANEGNAAFIGMNFLSDDEVVAHYILPDLTADVISRVNIRDGKVVELIRIVCDNGTSCPSEHHGGNPIVGPGGDVFVAIGDYGGGSGAQIPESPAGKILQISPEGKSTVFASGFRNPFDLVYAPGLDALVVGDNGAIGNDELNVVRQGDNCGWPHTMGKQPPAAGMVAPVYTFEKSVAPTGMIRLNGQGGWPRGILLGAFVTKAIYFFPGEDPSAWTRPIPLIELPTESTVGTASLSLTRPIIDIAQNTRGEVHFATSSGIFRVELPFRGDADGNGRVDLADHEALSHEILDGDGSRTIDAQGGEYRGSWGADANLDGVIDARDLVELSILRKRRGRAVR